MPKPIRTAYLIAAFLLVTSSAIAAPPDAGTLLNEQRQPGSGLPDRLPKPDASAVERPPLADSGARITVKASCCRIHSNPRQRRGAHGVRGDECRQMPVLYQLLSGML
jgi:hypothetical protein